MHPSQVLEIFLQPGECYFGDRHTRIRTVLGSCVSITFWHPRLLVGGMCHYLLPHREGKPKQASPDGRYADGAMELLLKEIDLVGAPHKEYQVKLFGGGDMFPDTRKNASSQVGSRNVEAARRLMKKFGFVSVSEHLGGVGHRNVIFDVWSGDVWVKHNPMQRHTMTD